MTPDRSVPAARWSTLRRRAGIGAVALAVAAGVASAPTAQAATPANAGGVAVDVGGRSTADGFVPDTYVTGGSVRTKPADKTVVVNTPRTVAHPIDTSLWTTARVGDASYAVPQLAPGASYQLRLYFLDWYWTQPGQRAFNVDVNGKRALTNFDIRSELITAGIDGPASYGLERDVPVVADANGSVRIELRRGSKDQPWLNAFALVPVPANAGGVAVDVGGTTPVAGFLPDSYATGGTFDTNPHDVLKPTFPNFGRTVPHPIPEAAWDTSRVGPSSYVVPALTPGAAYELRLYFLDWWTRKRGERVFNVTVNGQVVLPNFDINQAANDAGADGGQSFGVERDLPVTADASGAVRIDLTRGPVDQPQFNAFVLVPAGD